MSDTAEHVYKLKKEGLTIHQISHRLKLAPSDVYQFLEDYIQTEKRQFAESLETERQLHLERLDLLYSELLEELFQAETVICEVTGKIVVSKAKTKESIALAILKVLESRAKLLALDKVTTKKSSVVSNGEQLKTLPLDALKDKFAEMFR
ncbi:MAG: hypothetical protein ACRDBG_11120 [Waterburya sp.]